jgi:ribosome-binding factor A
MTVDRMTRVNELLRREIGAALPRLLSERGFDLASVMVTRVETARDLRDATVWVSIRDHEEQRAQMLDQIRRHRAEIQAQVAGAVRLKYTPRLTFALDASIEKGDRVLSLLSRMEADQAADPPEEP